MKHSEEYIEGRLKWRGKKNGLPKKNSHFFEELKSEEKQKFETILSSSKIGLPVIVFNSVDNHWTVFGTRMLASGSDSSFESMEYSEIDEHTFGDDPLGVFSDSEPKNLNRFRKFKQSQILVREKGGRMMTLHGSKGEEIYDMYNIMLMLERMTKDSN
ncbi:MAG: hypothetical protein ACJASQ_003154 [Crocinitomicaceae bacterium]|jgi:hypothetical protein